MVADAGLRMRHGRVPSRTMPIRSPASIEQALADWGPIGGHLKSCWFHCSHPEMGISLWLRNAAFGSLRKHNANSCVFGSSDRAVFSRPIFAKTLADGLHTRGGAYALG